MATFSITIDNKYTTETYEGTKKTYQWIYDAMTEAKLIDSTIKESFLFDIGKVNCSCENIQEFIDNAYGQSDYDLIDMRLNQINLKDKKELHVSVQRDRVRITSDSKSNLEILVGILEKSETSRNMYVENQYNIGTVNGENININQGENNSISISQTKENKSKYKQWMESIVQNLVANWIWWLLGALISGGGLYYLISLI